MVNIGKRQIYVLVAIIFALTTFSQNSSLTVMGNDEYYDDYEDEIIAPSSTKLEATNVVPASVSTSISGEVYEEYEYEYEYDDEEQTAQKEEAPTPFVRGPEYNGYLLHGGGGLMRITKPMVDGIYLNESSQVYDCPKKEESFILMLEADPDMDESSAEMLLKQVQGLRKRMEQVHQIFSNLLNDSISTMSSELQSEPQKPPDSAPSSATTNAAKIDSGVINDKNIPRKRLSFREKQAMRAQEKKEQKEKREKVKPKFRLGADCETLLCGSCKAVVEEFAELVYENIKNPKIKYLDQVSESLCRSKGISLKYKEIVNDTCQFFLQVHITI